MRLHGTGAQTQSACMAPPVHQETTPAWSGRAQARARRAGRYGRSSTARPGARRRDLPWTLHNMVSLQHFTAARLQGSKATRLQSCKAAKLQGSKATRLQSYKATKLQSCKATQL